MAIGAHLQTLEEAGYIKIEKSFVDRKPRTDVAITAKGAPALRSMSLHCVKFAGFNQSYESQFLLRS